MSHRLQAPMGKLLQVTASQRLLRMLLVQVRHFLFSELLLLYYTGY